MKRRHYPAKATEPEWGLIPSRRHRSLTVTSRRNPSSTMRIFSSGVYLRRPADFTVRTKDLVSSVRSYAATALAVSVWDIVAPLYEVLYRLQGAYFSTYLSGYLSGISASSLVPLPLTTYNKPVLGIPWL